MSNRLSRRMFLGTAGAAAVVPSTWGLVKAPPPREFLAGEEMSVSDKTADRIVDMHVHFDEKNPKFIGDFLKLSDRLNLTACLLTPFANRKVVSEAAKQHPKQIIPFGFVDLDAPDVVKQVEELHAMGYRGLGELEFVKKPYNDPWRTATAGSSCFTRASCCGEILMSRKTWLLAGCARSTWRKLRGAFRRSPC